MGTARLLSKTSKLRAQAWGLKRTGQERAIGGGIGQGGVKWNDTQVGTQPMYMISNCKY